MSFNWGILGPGRIATKFASAVSAIDGAAVSSVASRDIERATRFADEFGIANRYGSYNELLEDPVVDAVYIATPHRFHFEQAMLCLDAGKHVVCEKSITVNATQCRQLIDKAKSKKLFLMEALWTRFLPIYKEVRSLIDAGEIGEPRLVDSTFCFPVTDDRPDRLWRHDLAGGALLDIGVYNIAMSQWILGNPTDVFANGNIGRTNVDDQVSAILRYAPSDRDDMSPATAQFTCGFGFEGANDFTICGTKGVIRIHKRFWGASRASVITPDGDERIIDAPHRHNGFEYQIEAAMACIAAGALECPTMPHANSLANMELMDSIREAIGLRYDFE